MSQQLNIALIQMISTPIVEQNLLKAEELIAKACIRPVDFIVLPEFFIQITTADDAQRFNCAENLGCGAIQQLMADLAVKYQCYIVAGTILIKHSTSHKYYNTSIVFNPNGKQIAVYNKIHLFRFNDGVQHYDETQTFSGGDEIVTFEVNGFRLGLGICYDLRFPELFRQMGVLDGIVLPSAFTYATGLAHWELLCKSRAVENQCYFVGVNQGGLHPTGRHTYGHSLVVDPWGDVITGCAEGEKILYAQLERTRINEVRQKLPAVEHRVL